MNAPENPNSPYPEAYAQPAPAYAGQQSEPDAATAEDLLGPPKVDLVSVGMATLGALVSGFVGGVLILISTVLFLKAARIGSPGIFPYVLAIVGFVSMLVSGYLSLFMNGLVFPGKYKEGMATFGQTFAFSILLFILIVPMYVFFGSVNVEKLSQVFIVHVLVNAFGFVLVSEILSNYRYAVLAVYSGFAGFLATGALSLVAVTVFEETSTTLYSLVGVIVVANVLMTFFRLLTELCYYQFYRLTGIDPIGDIYARIERDDAEAVRRAEKELVRFE